MVRISEGVEPFGAAQAVDLTRAAAAPSAPPGPAESSSGEAPRRGCTNTEARRGLDSDAAGATLTMSSMTDPGACLDQVS